jgi:hypothetical protein
MSDPPFIVFDVNETLCACGLIDQPWKIMSISRHELGSSRSLNLRIGINALHSPATESGRSWFELDQESRCKPVLVFGVAFRPTRSRVLV